MIRSKHACPGATAGTEAASRERTAASKIGFARFCAPAALGMGLTGLGAASGGANGQSFQFDTSWRGTVNGAINGVNGAGLVSAYNQAASGVNSQYGTLVCAKQAEHRHAPRRWAASKTNFSSLFGS